jgi:hypothetical protein
VGIDHWIFQGFTIRDGFQGYYAVQVTNTRLRNLEIYNIGQEAVHWNCQSTDNVLEQSWIYNTGLTKPSSGEAVYDGTHPPSRKSVCGNESPDVSARNQVLNNRFGPNVRAEDVDVKPDARDGLIEGNVSDGTGKVTIRSHFEASISLQRSSSGFVVRNNRFEPAAQDGADSTRASGIFTLRGSLGHTIEGNYVDMTGASRVAYRIDGSEHVCKADNVAVNGTRSNVACDAQ